jgi:hypothetical protein
MPGGGKGATFVGDAKAATEEIMKTDLGRKLLDKGMCYIRLLSDREHFDTDSDSSEVHNHW